MMAYNTLGDTRHGHGHRQNVRHRKQSTPVRDDDGWDPLEVVTRPPENETQSQKSRRVKEETHAKAISEAIDEDINRQRHAKRKKTVKLLLLGQSESGKSTLLKNFQLLYTPKQFKDERASWRSIVYLNILRSVRLILEAVKEAQQPPSERSPSPPHVSGGPSPTHKRSSSYGKLVSQSSLSSIRPPSSSQTHSTYSHYSNNPTILQSTPITQSNDLTPEHTLLFEKLSELHVYELSLISRLSVRGEMEATTRSSSGRGLHEFAVLASSKWKEVKMWGPRFGADGRGQSLAAMDDNSIHDYGYGYSHEYNGRRPSASSGTSSGSSTFSHPYIGRRGAVTRLNEEEAFKRERAEENRIAATLRAAMNDIDRLWMDPVVRGLPSVKRLWLEEYPGFFLDSLERVTAPNYLPTEDDVLKARLKTLGVTEYHFSLQSRYPEYSDWRVFDVGGTRCQREYWVPYFDDMDAIIFLAPISCFDQNLVEDESTNRLQDSIELWTNLCKNKLLKNCNLVLFLNKCDILEKKLNSGIEFGKYVKTYGDQRGNDFESVRQYLRRKFEALQKHYSPVNRPFYCHYTALTNRKNTNNMLTSVTDMVIRQNIASSSMF